MFGIQPVSGEVVIGDEFRCYDSHHPVDYRVRDVQSIPETLTMFCDGFYGYDDFLVGATLDTTKRGVPFGFHYCDALYPANNGAARQLPSPRPHGRHRWDGLTRIAAGKRGRASL